MAARRARSRSGKKGAGGKKPAAAPSFDVREGHQSPWTGCLGALFILALLWGYAVHRIYELPGGGPPIGVLFDWLPPRFRFHEVNRDLFDILALVGLLFQFMSTWELLDGPRRARTRGALGAVAVAAVVAVWICPPGLNHVGGALLSTMEITLFGIATAFLVVGSLGVHTKRRALEAMGLSNARPRTAFRTALRPAFVRWASLYVLFTLAWLVYVTTPYYVRSAAPPFENWRITVTLLWVLFGLFGLPYALWTARSRRGRAADFRDPGLLLFLASRGLFLLAVRNERRKLRLLRNRRMRSALLDLLVKAFFLPLMVTFLFLEAGNFLTNLIQLTELTRSEAWSSVLHSLATLGSRESSTMAASRADTLFKVLYGILRGSLYVIDVSVGLIGYACSFWWLDNKSKSVEPTFAGWLVTLACYPPLSLATSMLLPFGVEPGPVWAGFRVPVVQNGLLLIALAGNAIYVYATLAFGLRFSNLTNRGIITRGPYRFVRHPAYAAKVVAWWCEAVPVFGTLLQMTFFLGWVGIYFLRAITEERHLSLDPCYQAYCRAVKYRFVPGVW